MRKIKVIYVGLAAMLLMSLMPAPKKITLWLIGDSTMAIKETKAYPETGWGMPFVYFFDSTVQVDNRAKNGRSSKSFVAENLWQPVLDKMQEGDYVFIQFGHNDESKDKGERYSPPELFKENLLKYVNETRSKKAVPILITPVSRRKFTDGKQVETHAEYSPLVRQVADANNVLFIDLDTKSRELYQQFGEETSKLLFLQVKPGEHPNYPNGREDNTHFSELGARLIAQIVLKEINAQMPELAQRVKNAQKK
jgi:lysophospholipase L1-like esterase